MPRYAETQKLLERDLSEVPADAAVKNIEMWEESLSELDSKEGKALAKNLGALKKALGKKEPNGEEIQELMQKLGEQTLALAEQAPDAAGEKLRHIGERLSGAAPGGADMDAEDDDAEEMDSDTKSAAAPARGHAKSKG